MFVVLQQHNALADDFFVEAICLFVNRRLVCGGCNYSVGQLHVRLELFEAVDCLGVTIVFIGIARYVFATFSTENGIHCARQKAVKLLDELEHEYQLIERRRQGLGKPNLLYVKDLYAGLSQSNYWKYENQTSGGLKSELPGVWKSNGSKTDINNNTDSSETDLIYSAQSGENISGEMREDERCRLYFQDKLEIPILEKNSPHDREILMEILELLVETVTSRKKFLRICGEEKPKEVVKSRLMKLDSMHIQYVMECLKSNTTQVRNIKQYLLATLYNAPTTIDSYYAAQVRHDFGWGGRSN